MVFKEVHVVFSDVRVVFSKVRVVFGEFNDTYSAYPLSFDSIYIELTIQSVISASE